MEKFAILIPVYNEEYNVLKLSEELDMLDVRYLFVDDGSIDDTMTHLFLKDLPYIGYFPNRGKGFAIKLGAKYLIKEGFEWILIMDGDRQCAVNDIEKFDSAMLFHENEYKIFIGDRMKNPEPMPFFRRIVNKIMSKLISLIIKEKISDTQCGFRLIHKDVFEKLGLKGDRFDFESEMLIKAKRAGYKICSVPIKCNYFRHAKSKIKIVRDSIRFIKMLLKINKN